MSKTLKHDLFAMTKPFLCQPNVLAHLLEIPTTDMFQLYPFELIPNPFLWIQLWSIPWQALQVQSPDQPSQVKHRKRKYQNGNNAILTQPQGLTGLGGIGKTQTAVEYAHRYQQEYQAILWINGDTRETMMAGFAAIAATLQPPEWIACLSQNSFRSQLSWICQNSMNR